MLVVDGNPPKRIEWTVQRENKKKVADKVAEIVACSAEEVAITRNSTESLDLIK